MEGKAMLFNQISRVDAFPICSIPQDTRSHHDRAQTSRPPSGTTSKTSSSAPRLPSRSKNGSTEELEIPVFHETQTRSRDRRSASFEKNATRRVGKAMSESNIVINRRPGAALATAICKLLITSGGHAISSACDRNGAPARRRTRNPIRPNNARPKHQSRRCFRFALPNIIRGADVSSVSSAANVAHTSKDIKADVGPISCSPGNPDHGKSRPSLADPRRIMATGRSDFPNQSTTSVLPRIVPRVSFASAPRLSHGNEIAAAEAIANVIHAVTLLDR